MVVNIQNSMRVNPKLFKGVRDLKWASLDVIQAEIWTTKVTFLSA